MQKCKRRGSEYPHGRIAVLLFALWCAVFALAFVVGAERAEAQPSGVIIDGQGEATLSWTPPDQMTNGDPLAVEDIGAYALFWGEQPRADACDANQPSGPDDAACYPESSLIENGAVQSSMLTLDLSEPTTIYFAVAAQHAESGVWSEYSNEPAKEFELDVIDEREPGAPSEAEVAVSVSCETDTAGVACTITVSDPE